MDWFGPLPMRALTDSEKHNEPTPQEEERRTQSEHDRTQ